LSAFDCDIGQNCFRFIVTLVGARAMTNSPKIKLLHSVH
jgi:hypothetical protein